ncbi:MAG: hypothetical protein ACKVHU_13790 [Acidimicrobiales bacterium]
MVVDESGEIVFTHEVNGWAQIAAVDGAFVAATHEFEEERGA